MSIPFVYHPIYSVPFPAEHRFRMEKFRLLYEKLLQKNIINNSNIFVPQQPVTPEMIEIAHSKEYIDMFFHNKL